MNESIISTADWKRPFLLLALWAVAMAIVGPSGDFPLNDDWHYGLPVLSLWEEGAYLIDSAFAPNIFFHVAWGYLFCFIGGSFSFTLLRYSVLFWAVVATLLFYQLLKGRGLGPNPAFSFSLLLFFNPVFFSLSFSFMTGVPFLALSLLSIFLYGRALKKPSSFFRFGGFAAAILAFLIRQPGILIPIAFEAALLFHKPGRVQFYRLIGTVLFLALAYLGVEKMIKPAVSNACHYIPAGEIYLSTLWQEPATFVFRIVKYNTMSVFYIGLFALPFFVSIGGWAARSLKPRWLVLIFAVNVALAVILLKMGRVFPFGGNILYNFGLGPLLLVDVLNFGAAPPFRIPTAFVFPFGLLCQLNGSFLLLMLGKWAVGQLRNNGLSVFNLFLLILLGLYMPLMTVFSFFDRFLLLPLAIIILLIAGKGGWPFKTGFGFKLGVLIFALFSIFGTRDYLMWNRTADALYGQLLPQDIPPANIDGGVAQNGFHIRRTENPDADYLIAFSRLPGYAAIREDRFTSWLHGKTWRIYILKCEAGQ